MALIMALGIMLVLTAVLSSVIFLTASSARDAQRTNAGQKAYDLAEAGINNALAVLNANYPTTVPFPGDFTLLSGTAAGEAGCPCTNSYAAGSVVWNGSLVNAPATATWTYEWHLTATGSVVNPTGPTTPVTRISSAVVPVVIPDTTSIDPRTNALNWVYGFNVSFAQSVTVASPVFAAGDLNLLGTATISETIPATPGYSARPNSLVVVGNVRQNNTGSNQNHIGHVNGSADPGNDLGDTHIGQRCAVGASGALHTCQYGTTASPGDWIFAATHDATTSGVVDPPSLTCCASGDPGRSVTFAPPVDGTSHPGNPSDLGFWYNNSDFGPSSPCALYTSTGSVSSPLRFDSATASPTTLARDGIINQSAYVAVAPFDLTPASAGYDCRSVDGTKQLSWNGTGSTWNGIPSKTLVIHGTIFIDGSATSTANPATYKGSGAIILSGTFRMTNGNELCIAVSGANCDLNATWDPNLAGMFIIAAGDFQTDRSTQSTGSLSGESIDMKQAQYQGGLVAGKNLSASVTGTVVDGPMISAYADVIAGQSGILSFPPIAFPSSGTDGFTGPFPIARLLAPRQFGGS